MKSVMITGALSGLGLALASYYLQKNHIVFVSQRTRDEEHESAFESLRNFGTVLRFFLDLQSKSSLDRFWNTFQKHPFPQIWIHNAASFHAGLLLKYSENFFEEMFVVNIKNTRSLLDRVAIKMASGREGHILNIVSHQAYGLRAGLSVYAMTKGFLLGLTQDLALRYGEDNVCVNAIFPGWMKTKMTEKMSDKEWNLAISQNVLKRANSMSEICRSIYELSFWKNISGQSFFLDSRIVS